MGLTMEFHVGPAGEIGEAFARADYDALRAASLGFADFSLHLSPSDLDLFCDEVNLLIGTDPLPFSEMVVGPIAGDTRERGAFVVMRTFVERVAAVPVAAAPALSAEWMKSLAAEYADPAIQPTPEAALAVESLLRIARQALAEDLDMLYCWSL